MSYIDEMRLMVKVARLYYERKQKQADIAAHLNLSQATVSRLLKRAEEEEIVRIKVSVPHGVHPDLEEQLQEQYGLEQAIVVDSVEDEDRIMHDIGAAAAYYLETTVRHGEVIGISSWSSTLLAMVDAMHQLPHQVKVPVIQILGGLGDPKAQVHAAQLTRRLATLVNGESVFLPAPGLVGSTQTRDILLQDPYVQEVTERFSTITLALVGIGTVEPSRLLASSGNVFSSQELDILREHGAVGDVCVRFFDGEGNPVITPLNERVIGVKLEQLKTVKRSIGVAGGQRKLAAIQGALKGKWINGLITDALTAQHLIQN